MALKHYGRVGKKRRHRIAALDAVLGQRRSQPPGAHVELAVGAPQRSVDDRRMRGKDGGRALEKAQRRQRLEIGRVAVEIEVIRRFRHAPT